MTIIIIILTFQASIHYIILSIITLIGCILSVVGMLLTIAAYIWLWKYVHDERHEKTDLKVLAAPILLLV